MTGVTQKIADQKANDRQVGGDHYRTSGPQHWDLFGLDYLIGYATKYMRWRKKGGVQDLEKAIHVIEKIREVATEQKMPTYDAVRVMEWQQAVGLDFVERQIVNKIMFMRVSSDLDAAIEGIRYLIEHAQQSALINVVTTAKVSPEMTVEDLERSELVAKNEGATRWGAAVGARHERIQEIDRELARRERPDADESRHASLYPWQMTHEQWEALLIERRTLMLPFYVQRGVVRLLDVAVVNSNLPRELAPCYTLVNTTDSVRAWILRVDRVPQELRDMYPRLPLEQNGVERDQLPDWQRVMYEWTGDEQNGKWLLRPEHAAWGPEI